MAFRAAANFGARDGNDVVAIAGNDDMDERVTVREEPERRRRGCWRSSRE